MPISSAKHFFSIITSLLLILGLFVTAWLFPSVGFVLGLIFLLFGFISASYMIVKKHRHAYLEGNISRSRLIHNIGFEIIAVLLAMATAGFVGRYLAGIATQQISHDLTRVITGIFIGLLVGFVIGIFIRRTTSRLVRT